MAPPGSGGPASRQAERSARTGGAGRRSLRVAAVLGDQIIQERLLRERKQVTLGQSPGSTISAPLDTLPAEATLFTVGADGGYELHITESMDGRLADGGDMRPLASWREDRALRQGEVWVLPVSDSARGKLTVGDLTLMFQFVDEPARHAPVRLPDSVRSSFFDRIDPTLAIVLAISLLVHFGVGFYAYQRDRVIKKRTERVFNATFEQRTVAVADLDFDQPKEPTAEAPAEKKEDKPAPKDEAPRSKPSGKPRTERAREPGGGGRSAEEALQLQEEAIALANNLLSDDFSESGIGGGSSDRDPKNDLGDAIAAVRRSGARVEVGGGAGGRGTRGEPTTEIGTGQGPQVEGPGQTTTRTEEKVREKVPKGRIKMGDSSTLDETTLRPDDVLRKIQTVYMNGLLRCQKDLLKRDPSAGGRVNLRFTVGETGRVVRVKADGFDPGVDRCIETQANNWRFGVPKDEDGEITDASFKISLALQPS